MAGRHVGFRLSPIKRVLAITAMSLMLIGCGGGGSDSSDVSDNGGASDDAPAAGDAQTIFSEQGCAECHGEQGEGIGGEPETVVAGTNMIEQQFVVRIRNGRGAAMPGYSAEQISDDEVLLLYEWLKNQ